jgi:hypothetical protein
MNTAILSKIPDEMQRFVDDEKISGAVRSHCAIRKGSEILTVLFSRTIK